MWQEHTDSGGRLPLQPGTAYCSVYGECPLWIVASAFGGVVMFRDEVGRHIYILSSIQRRKFRGTSERGTQYRRDHHSD